MFLKIYIRHSVNQLPTRIGYFIAFARYSINIPKHTCQFVSTPFINTLMKALFTFASV